MIRERDDKFISFRQVILCRFGNEMHAGFSSNAFWHGISINSLPRLPLIFYKLIIN